MEENSTQSLVDKSKELFILTKESIQEKIYEIRGEKVMLDFELAEIYGYETKNFNRQVKNNFEKFDGFIFQLTRDEINNILWCKKYTLNKKGNKTGMHIKYLPYAFTEQGVYMLMTVLRGPLATEQSRKLVTIFKEMKDYIVSSNHLLTTGEILKLLGNTVNRHDKDIMEIKNQLVVIMDNFIDPKAYKDIVIQDGHKFDADIAYKNIYSTANKSIIIVDDYIGPKTLELLKNLSNNIKITIYSDNKAKNKIDDIILNDYINQTGQSITIIPTEKRFHDRYIVIDDKDYYLCGSSSKDSGNKVTTIVKLDNNDLSQLIKKPLP